MALPTTTADSHGSKNPKNVMVSGALPVDLTSIADLNPIRASQLPVHLNCLGDLLLCVTVNKSRPRINICEMNNE